jgi:indoleamine 2,3-dioxygenase
MQPQWNLDAYDMDAVTGFLPSLTLTRLDDVYYAPWESLLDGLSTHLKQRTLVSAVAALPLLSIRHLSTPANWQRAFVVLSFLSHAYVWGDKTHTPDTLPAALAVPWCHVAEHLGCQPIVCYASTVLWNCHNKSILETFTDTNDEAGFYYVSWLIESHGGKVIQCILSILNETTSSVPNMSTLVQSLQTLLGHIQAMTATLSHMYTLCNPHVFYWHVRPFLSGWYNMPSLPSGLHYQGVDPPGTYRAYAGGSAGQSSLVQLLDIALGIRHCQIGSNEGKNAFVCSMRDYMPAKHAHFLADMQQFCNLRAFVTTNQDPRLHGVFNACIDAVGHLRDKHLQLVTLYIVIPARKLSACPAHGLARHVDKDEVVVGTGGSRVVELLKQLRNETRHAKV